MELIKIQKSLNLFEKNGGTVLFKKTEDPKIVFEIEKSLGLNFPYELREFYRQYEYLQIGGVEIEWIKNLSSILSKLRKSRNDIPLNYLPIQNDGMGGYYYIVCTLVGEIEPENIGQILYNPLGKEHYFEFCCKSFFSFIIKQIELENSNI